MGDQAGPAAPFHHVSYLDLRRMDLEMPNHPLHVPMPPDPPPIRRYEDEDLPSRRSPPRPLGLPASEIGLDGGAETVRSVNELYDFFMRQALDYDVCVISDQITQPRTWVCSAWDDSCNADDWALRQRVTDDWIAPHGSRTSSFVPPSVVFLNQSRMLDAMIHRNPHLAVEELMRDDNLDAFKAISLLAEPRRPAALEAVDGSAERSAFWSLMPATTPDAVEKMDEFDTTSSIFFWDPQAYEYSVDVCAPEVDETVSIGCVDESSNCPMLPDETWMSILSQLKDYASLRNAAMASKQLYRCAASACMSVLASEIGDDILPEAIAALESLRLHERVRGSPPSLTPHLAWPLSLGGLRIRFSIDYLSVRPAAPRMIPFRDASQMSRLHAAVTYFSKRFRDAAFTRLYTETVRFFPTQRTTIDPMAAIDPEPTFSRAELARFMRAFYRLEIYCNLYKEPTHIYADSSVMSEQRTHFFSHFSNWEKEQFVAVAEFLAADIVEPPLRHLRNMTISDPTCDFKAEVAGRPASFLQYQWRTICRGLELLHKVATSPDADFLPLLRTLPPDSRQIPYELNSHRLREAMWLVDAFGCCINVTPEVRDGQIVVEDLFRAIETYTREDYRQYVARSIVPESVDDDGGPEAAWYWAYKGFPRHHVCNDNRMINCRRFGYVFWDREKIDRLNFMQRLDIWRWQWLPERPPDWEWTIDARYSPRLEPYDDDDDGLQQEALFMSRRELAFSRVLSAAAGLLDPAGE